MITKKEAFRMLYKFLKEKRILDKYISNIQKYNHSITMTEPKAILWEAVTIYKKEHILEEDIDNGFLNLFNYAPSSFYWDQSIEGAKFWDPYYDKWHDFRQVYLRKYKEEIKV